MRDAQGMLKDFVNGFFPLVELAFCREQPLTRRDALNLEYGSGCGKNTQGRS